MHSDSIHVCDDKPAGLLVSLKGKSWSCVSWIVIQWTAKFVQLAKSENGILKTATHNDILGETTLKSKDPAAGISLGFNDITYISVPKFNDLDGEISGSNFSALFSRQGWKYHSIQVGIIRAHLCNRHQELGHKKIGRFNANNKSVTQVVVGPNVWLITDLVLSPSLAQYILRNTAQFSWLHSPFLLPWTYMMLPCLVAIVLTFLGSNISRPPFLLR